MSGQETTTEADPVARLRAQAGALADLRRVRSLLLWDQQVMMPRSAASARSAQVATLARLEHELLTGEQLGALLATAAPEAVGLGADLVRAIEVDRARAARVPAALAAELAGAAAQARAAWQAAREAGELRPFVGALRRNVALQRDYAACFPEHAHPYDALLDRYGEGDRVADVRDVLDRLREGLLALLGELRDGGVRLDGSPLERMLPRDALRAFVAEVVAALGADGDGWRVDETMHPFATGIATSDVRITTNSGWPGLRAVYAAIHEFGHGLYERGFDPALARTTLDQGASCALHESQSRLWECFVGRGAAFWRWLGPRLQGAFPGVYDDLDADGLFRASNAVGPSPIRVYADEVTYGLHIALRFELELALIEGTLAVEDLADAWRERTRALLGLDVPDDRMGVLQDVHWAIGLYGYFPSYSLGNVLAAQLWERIERELPALDDEIARGEFGALREWLRTNVHRHGRRHPPRELIERVVGGPLDPAPLVAHLRRKLASLHGLEPGAPR